MSGMCSQRERAAHLQRHLACKLAVEAPFSRHTETRQAIPGQGGVPGVLHSYWACRQGGCCTVLQGSPSSASERTARALTIPAIVAISIGGAPGRASHEAPDDALIVLLCHARLALHRHTSAFRRTPFQGAWGV